MSPQDSVSGLSPTTHRTQQASSHPPRRGSDSPRWFLWLCLVLLAATALVYAPVQQYDFVTWDDPQYVSENPHVFSGLTWPGVAWAFTTGYFTYWHPLTWLSHMLDVQIYGMNAGGHHVTNVLLHIANTLLLFGLLYRMTEALGRSAFVAGLFAVHPLHVESVAWVAERKDVLSTLFWMLTLWSYLVYARQPRRGRYLVVLLLFALGLMAKPMLVTLPFVLLLLDVWPLRRVSLEAGCPDRSGGGLPREQGSVWLRLVREKLPLLALAVASSIVTLVTQTQAGALSRFDTVPLKLRAANASVSYVAYIGKMLWPSRLAALYPLPPSLPGWWVVGSILGLIGVTVLLIRMARRYPYLAVGWLWYLGTLVPVIGLVQAGSQARADRFTYVPLIGLFLLAGWGIPDLVRRWPSLEMALPPVAVLVILACAILARGQVRHWETSTTMWENTLAVTAENFLGHNNLGVALARQGRLAEAIAEYNEALRIQPDFSEAHNNLGNALVREGRLVEAIAHYTEALRLRPDYPEAHNNLAVALSRQGRVEEAIREFEEALRSMPGQASVHYRLAILLERRGDTAEAIRHLETALQLNPGYQEARRTLDDLTSRATKSGASAPGE